MALEQISFSSEQAEEEMKFYLALNDSSLSMEDSNAIMSQVSDVKQLLDEVMRDSLGGVINTSALSIKDQVEDLYVLAVGQIGIDPHLFFGLTPHEIELIYKGYLKDKELDTNLNIASIYKARATERELFHIHGEQSQPSTMAKRIETFTSLGI